MENMLSKMEELLKNKQKSYLFLKTQKFEKLMHAEMYNLLDDSIYQFLDLLPASVYWKDLNGVYRGANKAMLDIVGLSRKEELIGKGDEVFVAAEYLTEIRELDTIIIKSKVTIQREEKPSLLNTNNIRTFLSSKMPLYDEDQNIVGILGVSIDITEQKEAQKKELEEKVRRKVAEQASEFERQLREAITIYAGALAHDLKNPIHANGLAAELICVYLEQIQQKYNLPAGVFSMVLEKLKSIQGNHQLLTQIIDASNQMIQQLTVEDPKPIKQRAQVDKLLKASLTNCEEDLQRGLIHKEVQTNFELEVDHISFFRVLINLIDNARRQIRIKNKGQIFITTLLEGDQKKILVKDTAGGLTGEMIEQFFELYKTQSVQGTGLGLRGCRQFMESMGGNLQARLVDGDCVEFVMAFPH